ncbi:MAG: ComEC/Rec2 family competence protein, partial [Parcubacteria group bacterium]|nr:ComEC/Rec2 family competence protein [Parcubacteria group bacterium]
MYASALAFVVALVMAWQRRTFRIAGLAGLFFVLGMGRMAFAIPNLEDPSHIAYYNGEEVTVEGVITEEPDVRLDHQKVTVAVERLETPQWGVSTDGVNGRLLIKTALYPEYAYGDALKITCRIEAPEQIEDFAYDKYLARYDIYSVCWRGDIEKLDSGRGNSIMAGILAVKQRFMGAINRIISEPHAAFLSGLLVGARRGIPEYLLEAFARTGTTHIIAISGSNITIIAAVIIGFFQMLGISRRRAFWWLSAGIALFVIMTGATASVVRAGIMGIFVLLARQLGRASRATNALAVTAFLMLLFNPKILVFDAGFQLSFLATIGLVYINPSIQKFAERLPPLFGAREALATTLSAMATTTPLILYQFGRLSIIAPIANILILPAIPLTMALGFASGIAGMLWPPFGAVLAWLPWLFLEYMIRVAEFLSSLRFASFDFGSFHWVLLLAMYAAIGWGVWRRTRIAKSNFNIPSPHGRGSG